MNGHRGFLVVAALAATAAGGSTAGAQTWRQTAAGAGNTTRVLILGTRPEDEDNALIAWLSLGRHVETAYLSLTRGEAGVNVAGNERQSALGVVRTAELLAERARDGGHQYFTRAYDFGPTKSDSLVDAVWPHDSLLVDAISIVRAFKPQVIISLFSSDTTERDATKRVAARVARETFALAADSVRFPPLMTSMMQPWSVSRLLFRADSSSRGSPGLISVDVGELDRTTNRSFAEIGADIRRLQRSQPPSPFVPVGHVARLFRVDSTRAADSEEPTLFAGLDTTWGRVRGAVPRYALGLFDSLLTTLADVHRLAPVARGDSVAPLLARAFAQSLTLRTRFTCREIDGVPSCAAPLADLAASLNTTSERAMRAVVDADGIILDGVAARQQVAVHDTVPVSISLFNGSSAPLTVKRVAASTRVITATLQRDSIVVAPDSAMRWNGKVFVLQENRNWWQDFGLVRETWYHAVAASPQRHVLSDLITGEDRIPSTAAEATISIAGVDIPIASRPLVYRGPGIVRGDDRRAVAGVPPIGVLFEKLAEYERANTLVDRMVRVVLVSNKNATDTAAISLIPPAGLKVDSVRRIVVLPPFQERSVFFRFRGMSKPGSDSVVAKLQTQVPPSAGAAPSAGFRAFQEEKFSHGMIARDYPHIPSQYFLRNATERIENVDLKVPPRLHVAYVKGTDDVQSPLSQLGINVQALDASLLSVVDLSGYSTILFGAGALENDVIATAQPSLVAFMKKGGTILIMAGGEEVGRSGLLPFPLAFDSLPTRLGDASTLIRAADPKSQFLRWPNAITGKDFEDWSGERARGVPMGYDLRYRTVLSIGDADHTPTNGALLAAPVGRGMVIYSPLSLDRQLNAVNPGAARFFVNLLSAGLATTSK